MTSRWLVVAVVASLALNVAVVAGFFLARQRRLPPPLPGMRPEEMRAMMELRQEFDPAMDELRQKLHKARCELFQLAADTVPQPQAESLLQVIGNIRVEMNRLAYEHLRRVMSRLAPEARLEVLRRINAGMEPGCRRDFDPNPHWREGRWPHRRPGPRGCGDE